MLNSKNACEKRPQAVDRSTADSRLCTIHVVFRESLALQEYIDKFCSPHDANGVQPVHSAST